MRVIQPGGPYFKWPWEKVTKCPSPRRRSTWPTIPEDPAANSQGTILEAVTKDQLNTGLTGQIRYRVSEKKPLRLPLRRQAADRACDGLFHFGAARAHRQFRSAPPRRLAAGEPGAVTAGRSGISINDLRKNLRDINEHMDRECASSAARYGIALDASLITGIDPPPEVESALAAINTAYNQVSSDISLAQAGGRPEDWCNPTARWKSKRSKRRPKSSRSRRWRRNCAS